MKNITLTLFLFLSCASIRACDFACVFCHEFQETDFIFGGEIIQKGAEFVQIRIIDQFRGNESREIITIWSGTDFDCNGPFSMSANDFGNIGDTILTVTRLIEEAQNIWDVECDYYRSHFCFYSSQSFDGNWIWGWFSEPSFSYKIFKEKWNDRTLVGCENYESDKEGCESIPNSNIEINIAPNPTPGLFYVNVFPILEQDFLLKIFDAAGKMILEKDLTQINNAIDLNHFPSGVYFVAVSNGDKFLKTERVLKI